MYFSLLSFHFTFNKKKYKRLDYSWPSVFKKLLKFRVKKKKTTQRYIVHGFNHVSFISVSIEERKWQCDYGQRRYCFKACLIAARVWLDKRQGRYSLPSTYIPPHTHTLILVQFIPHDGTLTRVMMKKKHPMCEHCRSRDMIDRFSFSLKVLPYMLWWPSRPLSFSCEVIKRKWITFSV